MPSQSEAILKKLCPGCCRPVHWQGIGRSEVYECADCGLAVTEPMEEAKDTESPDLSPE